jgi:2'-5' RNA ligase
MSRGMTRATPSKGLRLFVAVHPPEEIARALLEAMRGLELPDHRDVPLEQVHLTLQFIGEVPAPKLEATIESVQRSTGGLGSFELAPLRLITLPPIGRARLVAAETDRPAELLELQRRLASRLAHSPRDRVGDRFRPHLTLCRFRSPASMRPVDEPVAVAAFPVHEIRLMRSTLAPTGARHDPVRSFPF